MTPLTILSSSRSLVLQVFFGVDVFDFTSSCLIWDSLPIQEQKEIETSKMWVSEKKQRICCMRKSWQNNNLYSYRLCWTCCGVCSAVDNNLYFLFFSFSKFAFVISLSIVYIRPSWIEGTYLGFRTTEYISIKSILANLIPNSNWTRIFFPDLLSRGSVLSF